MNERLNFFLYKILFVTFHPQVRHGILKLYLMKKIIFIFIFILALPIYLMAITLSGNITDSFGKPISFANVMVKGTSKGCTSNEKGFYVFSLDPGNYEIIFSHIGFIQQSQNVIMADKNISLSITMEKTELLLKVVTISGNDEDPAYRVIREAQKKRKYYLDLLGSYSCDVYIKGLQRMKECPDKIMGFKREDFLGDIIGLDSNGRGILYLSESVSKFNFKQPNHIKEEMISSKVSGDNKAFSYNQTSDMLFNFYENNLDLSGLSERGFISPISANAFMYYRYKLEGVFMENGLLVNKVKVIPKRKNDPVFQGYIYIVEDLWNIHSTDLYLTKDAQIDFVDTLEIQQLHSRIENNTWVPVSNKLTFGFGFMGIKAEGYFLGSQSNYVINPDFPSGFFGGEEMKVNDDANKKDSIYWEKTRPVALTEEEKNDYRFKDSLMLVTNTKAYKDSVDKKRNRFKIGGFLLSGYGYTNTLKKYNLNFNSGILNVNYNTVEGWVYNPSFHFYKHFENFKSYSLGGSVRYGFGNKHINGNVYANYYFKPQHFSTISFSAGTSVQQFNSNAIAPMLNSIYTILLKENYLKIFETQFASTYYSSEIRNGIYLRAGTSYMHRMPLTNTQTWYIKGEPEKHFTSNNPQYPDSSGSSFESNNALIANIGFTFKIKQRYFSRPNEKVILGTKYPEFRIDYKKGMGDVNFDFVKASVSKEINMKLFGVFKFDVSCGTFLNKEKLYFMDYKHFNGNQTVFLNKASKSGGNSIEIGGSGNTTLMGFNLLPYYQYSTTSNYIEAHAEHHFNGWIINKIPLLRKSRFQEVAGIHYLSTKEINQYIELSVGIEKIGIPGLIPGFLRVDFITAFTSGAKITNGIKIGIGM